MFLVGLRIAIFLALRNFCGDPAYRRAWGGAVTTMNDLPKTGDQARPAAALSVNEAMGRYAQGHDDAFELVYDAVAPRLEAYLRRHVRETARVEDIVQQTFLQMHSARGTFVIGADVIPWAFAIARRLMIDAGRKTRREERVDFTEDHDAHAKALASTVANSEEQVQERETRQRISAEYQRLTEPQRVAFDLVKLDGMSYSQAASVVGTTVTGIKLRLHRALLTLRAALCDETEPSATLTKPERSDEPVS
jgi:RNA polymerase sigma-70 factor (ECF subfamily)